MEKIKRVFTINYHLDWIYSVEIDKIREDLDVIEKLGATRVCIEILKDYDSSSVSIQVESYRLETDEECLIRLDYNKRIRDASKERDLAQLKALKDKYEG